jgi:uncharacterized protein YecE (DUF72 family)
MACFFHQAFKPRMKYFIGCSGFHYKEWKNAFYPEKLPQTKWFAYYATRFNTLELNVTFYRFPTVSMLNSWYEKSPQHFCFAVKAPRLITHYKKFQDTGQQLADFYGTIREGLKDKLGPVLFQLPRQLIFSQELLERIAGSVDRDFTNVIEFRDASWWTKPVYDFLGANRISFCGISHPALPDELIVNSPVIYYRYHGVPKLYYSLYEKKVIESFAGRLKKADAEKAFIFFNNTASLAAVENAMQLENALGLIEP